MYSRPNVRRWLPLSVLAVTVVVTLIASYFVRASAETRDRLRFAGHVQETAQSIRGKFEMQVAILRAGAAFLTASEDVGADEFRTFVARLELPRRYPGIQGIGYSVRIPPGSLDSLTRAMRSTGFDTFVVHPVRPRDEYHAIVYLEPLDARNRAAIGFDMFSEPTRRQAMEQARDSGAATVTRRVTLRQEIDTNVQAGFLIYVPVYHTSALPPTVEDRRRALRGFVYSPLRADDLLRHLRGPDSNDRVDITLFDGPDPARARVLHSSRKFRADPDHEPRYIDTVGLDIAGRSWSLVVSSMPRFEAISGRGQVPMVFVAGIMLSIVLFMVTRAEVIAREDAERSAASLARSQEALQASESRLRAIFNQAAVGIAETDLDGVIVLANERFAEILGCAPRELVGVGLRDLAHAGDVAGSAASFERVVTAGEPVVLLTRLVRRDGPIVLANVSASLIRNAAGAPANIVVAVEDVTARHRAEEALRESELRLRRLVESNIFGVASGEYGGAISYANDYFLEMLGYDRAALDAGAIRWERLTSRQGRETMRAATVELERRGIVSPTEAIFIRRDGSEVPVYIGSALLGESLVPGSRIIAFCLDLTERRRADDELRAAMEAVEAASRAKDRFLAVLSHELRTPLTPVMAALEAFDASELTPELRTILDIVARNVSLEARLIDDLLDLTRIANGKMRLFLERVDVHRLLRDSLAMVDEIQAKRLEVIVRFDARAHHVQGDSARIQQVIWNLVRNAARYTTAGGLIDIRTENVEGTLRIVVRDTGIGIAREDLSRIFDAFEQGSQGGQQHGGLGLGLAISRMLVEMHGGRLRAESPGTGGGSTFTIELPGATQDDDVSEATKADPEPHRSGGARILLVEDHDDTRRVLELLLRQNGYQVATASSVSAAMVAAESPFDVLVSDIGLPDGDGYELLARLRRRRVTPAIALSGYGMEEDLRRSREAGFADHLTKPVDIRRLHDAIERLME